MVELTRDHVRYALGVARRVPHPDWAQRESDALFGLLMASRTYDGAIGTFLGYAGPRIVWAIQDGLRGIDHLSRHGRREVKAGRGEDPGPPVSLHAPALLGASEMWGDTFTPANLIAAPDSDLDAAARISVQDALAALDTRGGLVVRLRYHGWTGEETGEFLGISESRVCQLYREGLAELRAALGIDSSAELLAA